MLFDRLISRLFPLRNARRPAASASRRAGANARRLQLEALEERVVLTFAGPVIYPVGPNAHHLAAADLTGDGILDLVASTVAAWPNDIQLAVLAGNGDGTFQTAKSSPYPGGSLVTGDVDGDGKADLIAVSSTGLNVMLSNGDGTVQPAQFVPLPPQGYSGDEPLQQHPIAAVVGDLNGDGHLDLIATGWTSDTLIWGPGPYGGYYEEPIFNTYLNVLLGTGTGTFDHAATFPLGSGGGFSMPSVYFFGPDVGDFDGDGNLDLLTSKAILYGGSGAFDYSALLARLGNGDGTFQAPRTTGAYAASHFIQHAVGDFNQDGRDDVLMGGKEFATATVALSNGDGTFTALKPFDIGVPLSKYWTTTEVGDINGDGKIDLLFVNAESGNRASVLLNKGDGTFAKPVMYDFGPLSYALQSPTLADFNGDGRADLAAVDRDLGVVVHMNTGNWNLPELGISDATVIEGDSGTTSMVFTVTLSRAATESVTVHYATMDGTARAGSDYQATSGTITFAPGETTQTITVLVYGDTDVEYDEYFYVRLTNPDGALLVDWLGVGTILNDDATDPEPGNKGKGKGKGPNK